MDEPRIIEEIEILSIDLCEDGMRFIGRIPSTGEAFSAACEMMGVDKNRNCFSRECVEDMAVQLANKRLTQKPSTPKEERTISGYFATFAADATGDVILPGSINTSRFNKTISIGYKQETSLPDKDAP